MMSEFESPTDSVMAAFDNYQNDPEALELRKYASNESTFVESVLHEIAALLQGKKKVSLQTIRWIDEQMVYMNQVAYVYRTIPSGTSPGRERVIRDMLQLVAQAHNDVKIIRSWLSDEGESILNEWDEERRIDKQILSLPPEERTEEARKIFRRC